MGRGLIINFKFEVMKKTIIIASISCNIFFLALTIRHFILASRPYKSNPAADFFTVTNNILSGLPKDKTDIIFFGDSQFANWHISEFIKDEKLKNRGINGDGTKGVLKRADNVAKGSPDKVFIEIGINDVMGKNPIDSIILNLQNTISLFKAKSPRTKLYILSVLPTKGTIGTVENILPTVKVLNIKYAYLCRKNHITFVDMDTSFMEDGLKKDYDAGDNLHLNTTGYSKLTEILTPYIKE